MEDGAREDSSRFLQPGKCIQDELLNFIKSGDQDESNPRILLFPDNLGPILSKTVRYQAAIYNLAAIYINDNNSKILAVCRREHLRQVYVEDCEGEDSEPFDVSHLRKCSIVSSQFPILEDNDFNFENIQPREETGNDSIKKYVSSNTMKELIASIDDYIRQRHGSLEQLSEDTIRRDKQDASSLTQLELSSVETHHAQQYETIDSSISVERVAAQLLFLNDNLSNKYDELQPQKYENDVHSVDEFKVKEFKDNKTDDIKPKIREISELASAQFASTQILANSEQTSRNILPLDTRIAASTSGDIIKPSIVANRKRSYGTMNTRTYTKSLKYTINAPGHKYYGVREKVKIMIQKWEATTNRHPNFIKALQRSFGTQAVLVLAIEGYAEYRTETYEKMGHVIELYNIPKTLTTAFLLNIYDVEPICIKRCDASHALFVTKSADQATRVLSVAHKVIRSRNMDDASPVATVTACKMEQVTTAALCNEQIIVTPDIICLNDGLTSSGSSSITLASYEALGDRSDGSMIANFDLSEFQPRKKEASERSGPTKKTKTSHITSTELSVRTKPKADSNLSSLRRLFGGRPDFIKKIHNSFVNNAIFVYPNKDFKQYKNEMFRNMNYIIELYGIPNKFATSDLEKIFREQPRYMHWCSDTQALLVCASTKQAEQALRTHSPILKSRAISESSALGTIIACKFILKPAVYNHGKQILPCSKEKKLKLKYGTIMPTSTYHTWRTLSTLPILYEEERYQISDTCMAPCTESARVVNTWADICLQTPTLIEKIKSYFGNNVKIITATDDYSQYYQNRVYQKMDYIIELFDVPRTYTAIDLSNIYQQQPRYIKQCDDSHALLVTGSAEQANEALLIKHEVVKSRPMLKAGQLATIVACDLYLPRATIEDSRTAKQQYQQEIGQGDTGLTTLSDSNQPMAVSPCHYSKHQLSVYTSEISTGFDSLYSKAFSEIDRSPKEEDSN